MKKILVTVISTVALFMSLPSNAGVNIGLKGGYNATSFHISDDAFDSSNRSGFFIGPSLRVGIPVLPIGFDVAVLYDQRDAEIYGETISRRCVNIPVNIRYEISLASLAGIYIAAGPQFSYNVGHKNRYFSYGSYEGEYNFEDNNISVNVGAGLMLLKHFELGVVYNIVVDKTGEAGYSGDSYFHKSRSNAWQVSVAWYF